jgi:predicted secreted hydrolase
MSFPDKNMIRLRPLHFWLFAAAVAFSAFFFMARGNSHRQNEGDTTQRVAAQNKIAARREARSGETRAATPRTPDFGVANRSDAFQLALPGYRYVFPRDHASHPAFATEWWYYTGHLRSGQGRRFGYQLTFFRQALTPRLAARSSKWAARDVIFAHLAITDEKRERFYFTDRIARAAVGLAGAQTQTPHVWIGDWTMRIGAQQTLRAQGQMRSSNDENSDTPRMSTHAALDLTQKPLKPPIVHGQNGVSQKSPGRGRASHYYSWTRLATRGTLRLDGETFKVEGQSWFDHEFGSNQMARDQVGWDWFSLQLNDGRELMLYRMRLRNGKTDPYSSGTIVEKNGRSRHLNNNEFTIESLATWQAAGGAKYPSRWRLSIAREDFQLEVEPTVADQELKTRGISGITYWEGSARVSGTQRGQVVNGQAYVELTGYDKAFGSTF